MRFIGGVRMWAPLAQVVMTLEKNRWKKVISSDGAEELETGHVAEVTDLVDLSGWPEGTRMIARREQPHPGAQLRFTDIDGYRYQVFVTDLADPDICYLEALYRGRGRVECAIRAKDTGLANLPSHSFAINAAWLAVVLIASDLLAWMKGLCLEGELARAEPKRLRYTLLHSAGSLSPRLGVAACASRLAGLGPTISLQPSGGCPPGPPSPERLLKPDRRGPPLRPARLRIGTHAARSIRRLTMAR
jgi:hypothetical protein